MLAKPPSIAGILTAVLLGGLAGCAPHYGPRAQNGITYYCPGAGNYDMGDTRIRSGLELAGYQGEVATFYWTIAPTPVGVPIDQLAKFNPRLRATILAGIIKDYIDRYPGRPVTLVGLSAGTGVALWACEDLDEAHKVDNVVLLSSSLSCTFDTRKALRHIKGNIYNYYSENDAVLTVPLRLAGTIDGVFTENAAGLVGFKNQPSDRVFNIAWRPEFARYGYYGGHVDSTAAAFVKVEIAPRVLGARATAGLPPRTDAAIQSVSVPRDGSPR